MTKAFFSEGDLDALGLFCREHRRRLRKQGKLPQPIKFSGPYSRNLYTAEQLEQIKALADKCNDVRQQRDAAVP